MLFPIEGMYMYFIPPQQYICVCHVSLLDLCQIISLQKFWFSFKETIQDSDKI